MRLSIASLSAYKRADAHLTRQTAHGAIGEAEGVLLLQLRGTPTCHSTRLHSPLAAWQIASSSWHSSLLEQATPVLSCCCTRLPVCPAVTILGILLGITLASHEAYWYFSGRETSRVSRSFFLCSLLACGAACSQAGHSSAISQQATTGAVQQQQQANSNRSWSQASVSAVACLQLFNSLAQAALWQYTSVRQAICIGGCSRHGVLCVTLPAADDGGHSTAA